MKSRYTTCFAIAASLMVAAPTLAHTPPAPQPVALNSHPDAGMPVFVQNIAPAAADAVKVVDAFAAAIKAVKIDEAAKLLDPHLTAM